MGRRFQLALVGGLLFLVGLQAASTEFQLPAAIKDGDYQNFDAERAELGRLLFYDRVLSGNYDTACATCHNHDRASSDGVLLDASADKSGGQSVDSRYREETPAPLHAPTLFNAGANQFTALFHNGRVAVSSTKPSGFETPAGGKLPKGLSRVLAAQSLFPLTNPDEMAGRKGENEIADAVAEGNFQLALDHIARRVRELEEYLPLFAMAYPEINQPDQITIQHIANAIGDFVASEWRSDNSPFDRFLRGQVNALSRAQKDGMELFYGKGKCASCHSGSLQTDQKFYSLAMPQIGLTAASAQKLDTGRMEITGKFSDAFAFRTPSLRNVARTAPYGHTGAYGRLEGIIRHHLAPQKMLDVYSVSNNRKQTANVKLVRLGSPDDLQLLALSSSIPPVELSDTEIADLITFLGALTDEKGLAGRLGKPDEVPSSLFVD